MFGAYKQIACSVTVQDQDLKEDIIVFLKDSFINEGRSQLFDKLVQKFNDVGLSVGNCLEIL